MRGRAAPWLLVGPALLLFIGIVLVPIAMTVLLSFHRWGQFTGIETVVVLDNWQEVIEDPYFAEMFLRTFRIAILVTLAAVLIGAPEAYVLNRMRSPWKGIFLLIVLGPLLISVVARTLGWALLFGGETALVNIALLRLGLISEPLRFMFTETGVIIALTHVLVPFMVLSVWASLQRIDPRVDDAAVSLGASRATVLWRIVLPQAVPGILGGSIIVFALFLGLRGIASDTPIVGEIHPLPAAVQELREGDRILAIEGAPVDTLADYFRIAGELEPAPVVAYTVERDGRTEQIEGPFPVPARAAGISLNSAARDAGMQTGDVILAVGERPIDAFTELPPIVAAAEGAPVALRVWREGQELDLSLTPRRTDLPRPEGGFEARWLIGLESGAFFEHPIRRPGAAEVLPMAAAQTWAVVERSFDGLYHMVVGAISTCNLSGPIGIARVSGAMASDGIWNFVWFIAVLSTAIGLLNLFPIPVLDGGHLVFHAYEAVTGRPPSERVVGALMTLGLVLLLSLMAFAVFNDIFC